MRTLFRLLKLISPYRWWVVLGVLLSFATVGSSVGLMAMSAYLISKSAITHNLGDLSMAITWVRTFAIARAGLRYAERYISHRTTFRILTHLRVWFYQSIEPLAPARLQQYRSGDLLTRIISDIETLENFYVRVVVPPLAAALVTAFACVILGYFDLWLGVALLIFLGLTGILLPLITRWLSRQPETESIISRGKLKSILVDELQGMADLLAFGQDVAQDAEMRHMTKTLNQIQMRTATVRGLGDGLAVLLTGLAGLTILVIGIGLVSHGSLDGVYLALLPLTAIASFEAVQPLSLAAQNLDSSLTAANRLFDLIDTDPPVVDPPFSSPKPTDYRLQIQNLHFRYTEDESQAIDGLSLDLFSGQCLALIGPSGAGKTSLVNLLLRFWDYQEGEIQLGGQDLRSYRVDDLREMIAVVSQQTYLFNGTVQDNLWLANPDASEAEIAEVCQKVHLEDFINKLPQGYQTMIGENGMLLSGGERQRLAIARALLKDSPILILDEVTTNLDAITVEGIMRALRDFMVGRTTIFISHQRGGLDFADQVLVMENGQIISSG